MPDELGKIKIAVEEADGKVPQAPQGDGEGDGAMPGGGDQGGGFLQGILDGIMSMSASQLAMLGALGAIAGLLLSMEPIQQMLKGFMKIFQAFMIPLAMMLLKLMKPIMAWLIDLLPAWLDFWKDPIGNLWALVEGIGEFIWNAITGLPGLIAKAIASIWEGTKETAGDIFGLFSPLQTGRKDGTKTRTFNPWLAGLGPLGTAIGNVARGEGELPGDITKEVTINHKNYSDEGQMSLANELIKDFLRGDLTGGNTK